MKSKRTTIFQKLLHLKGFLKASHKSEYFESYLSPKHFTQFEDIYQNLKNTDYCLTRKQIHFLELDFGASKRKTRATFGMPIYKKRIPFVSGARYQVYFYFMRLGQYKTLSQLHFINNRFFYGHINFSSDNTLKQHDESMIKNIVYSKYTGNVEEVNQIIDKNNNRLYIDNNVNFTINYLCDSPEVNKLLLNMIDHSQQNPTKKKEVTQRILEEAL